MNSRFTRLTNAFSKRPENHCHSLSLYFTYYNFCKIHKSLSVTPAMQAGLMKKPMTLEDIASLVPNLLHNKEEIITRKKTSNKSHSDILLLEKLFWCRNACIPYISENFPGAIIITPGNNIFAFV